MGEAVVMRRDETIPAAPVSETAAILQVIERAASNPSVDLDKMERLLEMQERVMSRQAKAEFAASFADMQREIPEIPENGIGHNKAKYALWEDMHKAVKPVLSKHGFAINFKTTVNGSAVTVTAILSHRSGHSEETTLALASDTSGNKNPVQAIGSALSYGQRYSAKMLLGLASRDGAEIHDDDGIAAGGVIDDDQFNELMRLIKFTATDIEQFCRYIKVRSVAEIPSNRFNDALQALNAKKAKMEAGNV